MLLLNRAAMNNQNMLTLMLANEAASQQLGNDIAAILAIGDVISLSGDLGMGKTTLARSIIRSLAGNAELEVPSPTFTLVQSYPGRVPVQHFDLYRLSMPEELEELGFAEAVRDGAVLVEWAERAAQEMPTDIVTIDLREEGDGRMAEISGPDAFMRRLQRSLLIRAFLDKSGLSGARRSFFFGDASARAYETVAVEGRKTLILMNAPKRPDGPPIRDGKPYSQIAHLAETVLPFVAIAQAVRDAGFVAPDIPAADLDAGLLLVEHLGDQGVLDQEGQPVAERYIASAQLLAAMHETQWARTIKLQNGVAYSIPAYDRAAMSIETELLTDWYIPYIVGRDASPVERDDYAKAWAQAFDVLDTSEKSIVLRDFHSPNIIWRGDKNGHERVGVIDFQDALIGPSAYDVASLAQDARVTISPELEAQVIEAYCVARKTLDRASFDAAYAIMSVQRNSKILGIFVRLNLRDGKPQYLKHLPRIRAYVARSLEHPALAGVKAFYEKAGLL